MNKAIACILLCFTAACTDNANIQSETSKKIWQLLEANDLKFIDYSMIGGNE